ncbi:MAG: class I SAM-dependent methyltransferase [Desulfobulbaceae bacterium]|nr:MAG: class I SAM-dependent methyltransferase [Desulfobulbaceae bacterium]
MNRSKNISQKPLYKQDQLPIFQNLVFDKIEDAISCPKGNILLVEDQKTGLIYNECFDPESVVYSAAYQNEQGYSNVFQSHLDLVSQIINRLLGQKNLIEIGCGKGYFLELLVSKNFEVIGFDPAYEGNSDRIIKKYFTTDFSGEVNGIILRHVLEHINNPLNFLNLVREATKGKGKVYIEVPCFDWICSHNAWFDIYYEHVNYFRLCDFYRMFSEIIESGKLFGGQYLYIVAELSKIIDPIYKKHDQIRFPKDFSSNLSTIQDRSIAVWGGSSRGVIFSLLKSRAGQKIDAIIDINPIKQEKYLPLTGFKVISPKIALPLLEKGSTVYIMNNNYTEEIKVLSNNSYNYIEL